MQHKIKKYFYKLFLFTIILAASFFIGGFSVSSVFSVSPDAIAIRIIPNQNHLGALDWYQAQKFVGSPQLLEIDGYEAVRDGRTLYVNAANIKNNSLYTNIYLISYNQNAEKETVDIFGRLISGWKFNSSIDIAGQCKYEPSRNCLLDTDCGVNDYCLSQKSKITRDVKRLADLKKIRDYLSAYKSQNNFYPKLVSGTYLPGKTISVWPSWQGFFSSELSAKLPFDPVNKIGVCSSGNYNNITCWDDVNKNFSGNIPSPLPVGSLVYAYYFINDNNYDLCANLETIYGNIVIYDCS